tara:strand:+ start:2091 stop:3308 length:1218 start_codon:yes stop_codon:yes gene_type:complete
MASTYTPLGIEKMATGENAGTWGTKTNTNLEIIEQLAGGYASQAVSGTGDTALAVSDGATGATMAHRVIELTGTITGNITVSIPLDAQQLYVIKNSTSGAYTVEFQYTSGSGTSVTWATTDKGTKLLYAKADDGTNPNIVDVGFSQITGTETLTNKTLESPKIDTGLFDTNGNESIKFTATGSAVNEITVTNAAASGDPAISATGSDTNIDLNLVAKGTGVVQSNGSALAVTGKQTIWVPATAMYATTTNGCADIDQTELTAGQPELKTLDFDPSTDENAQFTIAFPKAWDPSQLIMYQVFWTANSTNTGNCIWNLKGVAIANDDAIDTAFGTAVAITDAHSGTANDLNVTAQSGSVTIAGSPAADEDVFFNISRDANDGSDTFTGDAKLLGIKIFFATNLPNDA